MITIYKILIYNPLFNILVFFYQTIAFKDLGVAIIYLTILIRLILYPLSQKTLETQFNLQKIQPKIKEIQNKHKKDPQTQLKEIMDLYKQNNINIFSMYLFLIIQIPFLIALFQIFSRNFDANLINVYSFISTPQTINPYFLGFINLEKPNIILVFLASFFQFLQTFVGFSVLKISKNPSMFLAYFTTIFTFIILIYLPSAVSLYILITNTISFIQQLFINKKFKKENELARIY
jgi:YidC/Oxa1 family membrane protein insertase